MKCPTCKSPSPRLHPAMQHEGEVQPCRDEYHRPPAEPNALWSAEAIERHNKLRPQPGTI